MTDLKPENTLFDTRILKTYLIDLGGSITVEKDEELINYEKSKIIKLISTELYAAPEFNDS